MSGKLVGEHAVLQRLCDAALLGERGRSLDRVRDASREVVRERQIGDAVAPAGRDEPDGEDPECPPA